ncbi:Uncharacterized protein FWK35_00027241 [Aphis craccivora]|uniref:Uncharacterized protein n=1 Tax=Aphis craccivora TaxID=307492 RepID=A0A6G0WXD0_APHCR|nr:Uncharacterized protein FWK35_00027241 [Aphis craccivora]
MKNILSAFEACGINPYNPDIFPDYMYAPTTVNLYSKETNFFPEYHIFNGSSPTTLHIDGGAGAL